MWAVEDSNLAMCELLLSHYPTLVSKVDMEGATALHYACLNGNPEIVEYLLRRNSAIIADNHGETPLHCGIRAKRTNC